MADKNKTVVVEPVVDIDQLTTELTNKNNEYIFSLKKKLKEYGQNESEIETILTEILPLIIENQKKGITARRLFGTVNEFTEKYNQTTTGLKRTEENTTPWLMWLDNALLLLGVLALMNGIMGLLSKGTQNSNQGLVTLLLMAAAGGLVFYLMYYFFYRPEAKNKNKADWIKTIVVVALAILAWVGLLMLSALLPSFLNPVLPPIAILVLGGLALLGRWYLKRKYNIANAMMQPR